LTCFSQINEAKTPVNTSTPAVADVILRGGPEERGASHGAHLQEKIEGVVDFYGDYIGMREADVFVAARHFKDVVNAFSPEYGREIVALADAAGIDPLWIFAVNARSEITELGNNECTAAFFPQSGMLGQTWDWFAPLEKLIAVIQIELDEDHKVLMMTEPGIIGKIGINTAGLGVCLNFLIDPQTRRGLPIHILMRAILDSGSLPEAKTRISEAGAGRSGNLLVGAAEGEALAVEFRADASYELADDNGVYLHTNHYRGCDLRTGTPEQRANSEQRLARAGALAAASDEYSHQTMNELLSDCAHAEHPICSSYREHPGIPALLGTICTLIMDLPGRKLSLRRGNDPANGYTEYSL